MNSIAFAEWLRRLDACPEALEWAQATGDLEACWHACHRPDWMLWFLSQAGLFDDARARMAACRFVRETALIDGRTVWDLLVDPRSRAAVEVAERYADGEVTPEELAAARFAARDAAWAARAAARDATEAATKAATEATAWAAVWAARFAARDATRAAAWEAARAAAWEAAAPEAAAAGDAAWAARATAWEAARAAAWEAATAGDAAWAARAAARDAAWATQANIIRELWPLGEVARAANSLAGEEGDDE